MLTHPYEAYIHVGYYFGEAIVADLKVYKRIQNRLSGFRGVTQFPLGYCSLAEVSFVPSFRFSVKNVEQSV